MPWWGFCMGNLRSYSLAVERDGRLSWSCVARMCCRTLVHGRRLIAYGALCEGSFERQRHASAVCRLDGQGASAERTGFAANRSIRGQSPRAAPIVRRKVLALITVWVTLITVA